MKKGFLNLRKLGLVLVAAGSMAMYSCGGGEDHAEEAVEGATEHVEEVVEEVTETVEEAVETGAEEVVEAVEGAVDGAMEEGKCGDGHEHTEEGDHKCDGGKCGAH